MTIETFDAKKLVRFFLSVDRGGNEEINMSASFSDPEMNALVFELWFRLKMPDFSNKTSRFR